jgi:hypothetical protein
LAEKRQNPTRSAGAKSSLIYARSCPTGFCIGYVIGYSEGTPWGVALAAANVRGEMVPDVNNLIGNVTGSCVPADAPNSQLRDVVTKYLQENPASRHESARTLIWRAYAAAFPCG